METASSIKPAFGAREAFPTNIPDLIVRLDKCVVMIDVTVALGAPDHRFIIGFRV